jgi:N-acetylglutamate synthase-like GNAT family acetyltransferase
LNRLDSEHKIFLAVKSDKKTLKRFYKLQRYSASYIGLDHCFYISQGQNIIAAMIISQINKSNAQYLLHGLVVDKNFQHQGLALALLDKACTNFTNLVCFADSELSSLYLKANFTQVESHFLSAELFNRYHQYHKTKKHLIIFSV